MEKQIHRKALIPVMDKKNLITAMEHLILISPDKKTTRKAFYERFHYLPDSFSGLYSAVLDHIKKLVSESLSISGLTSRSQFDGLVRRLFAVENLNTSRMNHLFAFFIQSIKLIVMMPNGSAVTVMGRAWQRIGDVLTPLTNLIPRWSILDWHLNPISKKVSFRELTSNGIDLVWIQDS